MNRRIIPIFILLIIVLIQLTGCSLGKKIQVETESQVGTENQVGTDTQAVTETLPETMLKEDKITANKESDSKKSIILATTTSTQDSGLLDSLIPKFTEDTGIDVKVVAVGTGKAIQMGVDGEADVLLVHSKTSEEEFVNAGNAVARYDVMYNDFVLLGPKETDITKKAEGDIVTALTLISQEKLTFVSRGDDSGTDKKEKSIWKEALIEPKGDWYLSAGKGMGEVILMTDEVQGYTLSDRATFLTMKDKIELDIVVESDSLLLNQYGVIPVNPIKNKLINGEGAMAFVTWILSEDTQRLIGEFGVEEYGQALFTPNARQD